MLVTAAAARRHETPNAVMRTLAAPSLGSTDLSVWEVVMEAGREGPVHEVDREQAWTVLAGELRIEADGEVVVVGTGDTLRLPPDSPRRVAAVTDARAIVASLAGSTVTTPAGGSRRLPWAE
jgi:quercetin dioxygenase-like cupin family protein